MVFPFFLLLKGADIRFLNQHDDVIYLNVNDYINITFAIDWVNCSFPTSGRFLKVVAKTTEQPQDECKIILIKGTCNVSDTSPCFCMTPDGPMTFYKRITKPVNMTYEWLWYHGDEAKEKAVTVHILDVPLEVVTCCGRYLYFILRFYKQSLPHMISLLLSL